MNTLLVQDRNHGPERRQFLLERGCQVVECQSTTRAKDLAASGEFALIILDLEHRTQGEEFCRWLRARGTRRNRGFVLFGVEPGQTKSWAQVLAAGADDFFLQPLSLEELEVRLASVDQQLQQRREWQRTEDALNARAQQQVAIAALGQCALSEDLPTLIQLVSRFVIDTLEVEFCSLCELEDGAKSFRFVAGFGWREGWMGKVCPVPGADSLTGRTLLGEDLIVENLPHDERFTAADFLHEHGVVSAISVALRGKGKGIYGALGAYTARPRRFVDDDLRFMEGLAHVLGSAIERQRSDAEIKKQQSQVQHLQRLESVGQLAASLAHDYNNVLTIIHGHVTLALGTTDLPQRVASSLKTALEAIERAASLTRQLLSFSRKQELRAEPRDLNSAVTNMVKLLDRVLGRHIVLEIKPQPGLPAVLADAGMLDQVMMNLAVNARDAMPNGGRLVISTSVRKIEEAGPNARPEARPGEFVCLAVTDTGCGMDEATLRRIFDPFFTTKAAGKGTGLGLSTVYGIVKQHQGWVEVESEPGKGTTFRVMIPSLGTPVAPPGGPAATTALPSSGHSVLLVEDEPSLRDLARMLLEDLGHQVIEAGSAREAIALWQEKKGTVTILLTDLVLPDGLTGFELAAQLQQEKPDLRVVLTSGYSADEVRRDLPAPAKYRFLQKPYGREALARTLRECSAPSQAEPVSNAAPANS